MKYLAEALGCTTEAQMVDFNQILEDAPIAPTSTRNELGLKCRDTAAEVRDMDDPAPYDRTGADRDRPRPAPLLLRARSALNSDLTMLGNHGTRFSAFSAMRQSSNHWCTGMGACLDPQQHHLAQPDDANGYVEEEDD